MRSGSALSSGCLPALLRPEILLCPGCPSEACCVPAACLAPEVCCACDFKGFPHSGQKALSSDTSVPHLGQNIKHLLINKRPSGTIAVQDRSVSSINSKFLLLQPLQSHQFLQNPPLSQQNLLSPQASAPRHQSSSRILHRTLHQVQSITHNSPQPRLSCFTAATFVTLHRSHVCRASVRHIRLTSPRSHSPDSAQSPEPAFRSPDTAPQWHSLPPSSA